jgi:hypothetical protein
MDSFTDLKLTVSDSLAVMRNCLLYVPRSAADRTLPLRRIAYMEKYS